MSLAIVASLPDSRFANECSLTTTVLDAIKNGQSLDQVQAEVDAKIEEWFEGTQMLWRTDCCQGEG